MEIYSTPSLVDAKNEYTHKLVRILKKGFVQFFYKVYILCKEESENYHEEENVLYLFQEELSKIVDWTEVEKKEKYEEILTVSNCDWLDDLLTAVFVLHTKILSSIRCKNTPKKINLVIPQIQEFVYKCYVDISRELWKHAYIFVKNDDTCEYQKNYNKCEDIVGRIIIETLSDMLPIKDLLKEHLSDINDDSIEEEMLNTIEKTPSVIKKPEKCEKLEKSEKSENKSIVAKNKKDLEKLVDNLENEISLENLDTEIIKNLDTAIDTEIIKNLDTEIIKNENIKVRNEDDASNNTILIDMDANEEKQISNTKDFPERIAQAENNEEYNLDLLDFSEIPTSGSSSVSSSAPLDPLVPMVPIEHEAPLFEKKKQIRHIGKFRPNMLDQLQRLSDENNENNYEQC
jgi:hypothetical protein